MKVPNDLWVWGYVAPEKLPAKIPFVGKPAWCSLETGAEYMGAEKVLFLDSMSSRDFLCDDYFRHIAGMKSVLCGLQHHFELETAKQISEFSLTHPNVAGAVFDDFLDETGPSRDMTPERLREIGLALKSANPALKLYVVRYSRQNIDALVPYLPYIDGINFWVWVSTEHYWHYQYHQDLLNMRLKYGKPILQGFFLHDYGDSGHSMPLELVKLQIPRMAKELLPRWIEGIVILQSGWFADEGHREQLQWIREYFEWFYRVHTRR